MEQSNLQQNRRIWGHGFKAGLEFAAKQQEDSVNQLKIDRVLHGNSTLAAKVYSVVPIQTPWGVHEIGKELAKIGSHPEQQAILSALNQMKCSGLVKEPSTGKFIRAAVKEPAPKTERQKPAQEKPAQEKQETEELGSPEAEAPIDGAKDETPFNILERITEKLDRLSIDAQSIVSDMVQASIEIEEYVRHQESQVEKMRQLQALLKSIGV